MKPRGRQPETVWETLLLRKGRVRHRINAVILCFSKGLIYAQVFYKEPRALSDILQCLIKEGIGLRIKVSSS